MNEQIEVEVLHQAGELSPLELMTLALGGIVAAQRSHRLVIPAQALRTFTNLEEDNLRISQDTSTGAMVVELINMEVEDAAKN